MDLTTVTSISGAFDATQTMRWSVFVSGPFTEHYLDAAGFLADPDVGFLHAANIESGSVNGYRLRLGDNPALGASSDSLLFEKANGSGWSILTNIALAGTD